MNLGAVATGTGSTTFTMQYVPEQLEWTFTSGQFTNLLVSVQGDGVICNLDTTGLNSLGQLGRQGTVTNSAIIHLADGFLPGKVTTITVTNSGAQTPSVYATSKGKGSGYVVSVIEQALAGQAMIVDTFLAACFPNAGATDLYNIVWSDGSTEANLSREELQYILSQKQIVSNSAADYMLTNLEQEVSSIQVIAAAQQNIYKAYYSPKGITVGALNAGQTT